MSSQMFWLLSYFSLGLALSLGNRPTSLHGSSSQQQQQQQQQQKQQSTSSTSSQGQKLRQDNRYRDETVGNNDLRIIDTGPVLELDNLRSYRYVDQSMSDRSSRDYANSPDHRYRRDNDDYTSDNDNNNNHEGRSKMRENRFIDEFATAVLDTIYPTKRDYRPKKSDSTRYNDNANYRANYNEPRNDAARLRKKIRSAIVNDDYPRKITRSQIAIYRGDNSIPRFTLNVGKTATNERGKFESGAPRAPPDGGVLNQAPPSKDYLDWTSKDDNYVDYDDFSKRQRNNDIDNSWIINEPIDSEIIGLSESEKVNEKRAQGGRARGVANTRGGWSPNGQHSPSQTPSLPSPGASIASQFLLRSARGNRQYDVPQIECPASEDGMERFACPTPDRMGRYRCIDDHVLCDGFIDCPTAEDEDRQACMFYKTTKAHLDVLADALLRWARGR